MKRPGIGHYFDVLSSNRGRFNGLLAGVLVEISLRL